MNRVLQVHFHAISDCPLSYNISMVSVLVQGENANMDLIVCQGQTAETFNLFILNLKF
jgi:hypothetical protein